MKFVNYKILIGTALIVILTTMLINSIREIIHLKDNGSVVSELENELENQENHNKFLKEQLEYVKTDDFIERESREKLGLVKPGEVVVQEKFESDIQEKIEVKVSKPNWKLWLELFM